MPEPMTDRPPAAGASRDEQYAQAVFAMSKEPGMALVGFAYNQDVLVKPSEYDQLSPPEKGLAEMASFGIETANITLGLAWDIKKEKIAFRLAEAAAERRGEEITKPYFPSARELGESKQGAEYLGLTSEVQEQEFRARMANSFVSAAKAVKQLIVGDVVNAENVNAAFEVFYRSAGYSEDRWTPEEAAAYRYLQELADKVRRPPAS
jgi:myo-inositol-1-phosphate synthase